MEKRRPIIFALLVITAGLAWLNAGMATMERKKVQEFSDLDHKVLIAGLQQATTSLNTMNALVGDYNEVMDLLNGSRAYSCLTPQERQRFLAILAKMRTDAGPPPLTTTTAIQNQ